MSNDPDNLEPKIDEIACHGTLFDDGRRWCTSCQTPVKPATAIENSSTWYTKSCIRCNTIWPEYEYEYQTAMQERIDDNDWKLGYIH